MSPANSDVPAGTPSKARWLPRVVALFAAVVVLWRLVPSRAPPDPQEQVAPPKSTLTLADPVTEPPKPRTPDQDLSDAQRILAQDPDRPDMNFRVANSLLERGDEASALPYLRRALRTKEGPGWLWKAHYLACMKFTEPSEALQACEAFLDLSTPTSSYKKKVEQRMRDLRDRR